MKAYEDDDDDGGGDDGNDVDEDDGNYDDDDYYDSSAVSDLRLKVSIFLFSMVSLSLPSSSLLFQSWTHAPTPSLYLYLFLLFSL